MSTKPATPKAPFWNIWWTLMLLSGVGTIIVAILEGLGVFDDVGLVLSVVGIVLSIMFGVTASTRTAVRSIGAEVAGLRVEIGGVGGELVGVRADTSAIREGIRIAREQVGPVREEIGTLRHPLERILAILVERLPPRLGSLIGEGQQPAVESAAEPGIVRAV